MEDGYHAVAEGNCGPHSVREKQTRWFNECQDVIQILEEQPVPFTTELCLQSLPNPKVRGHECLRSACDKSQDRTKLTLVDAVPSVLPSMI